MRVMKDEVVRESVFEKKWHVQCSLVFQTVTLNALKYMCDISVCYKQ